jgi:hypothetical protein
MLLPLLLLARSYKMEKIYKVIQTPFGGEIIQYEEDGILYSIPKNPANSDYQEYLKEKNK